MILSRAIDQLGKQEMREIVQEILDKKGKRSHKQWIDIIKDYDLNCSPDHLRKVASGIILANDSGMRFNYDDQDKIDRGFLERQKIYDIQKQVRKDMREMSRTELICESIEKAIKELPPVEIPESMHVRKLRTPERDLVVGIGDFHYGAEFNVIGLYNETINKYNSSVFERRISDLTNEIVNIVEKDRPDQITIMIAGDMLDGLLRTSQLQRLEFGVIESAIRLSETLTSWLAKLGTKTGVPIRVFAVRGNHGEIRPLGSKAGQFPEENMERIVMHYLFARFNGMNSVLIARNDAPMTQIINVCGYTFLLTHGQNTSIESLAKDCVNLYHKPIDIFMVGHLHKEPSFTIYVSNLAITTSNSPNPQFDSIISFVVSS